MAEDIFYTAWLRQDPNFFYLPMWQGEIYAFQLNFDSPISDPDFDNFRLGLYKNNGELSDRVVDELGTLTKVPVSLIEYNIQCEFTLPVDVVDGFYNLIIYDSTDDTVKAQSNCIAIGPEFNRNKYTVRAIWRNSEDINNFAYEGNEAFYNKMRLPILCEDIQFEDERQQYRDSTSKNYRNFNSYRAEVHLLQSHYFDQNEHRAVTALYNSDEIFINGNFYVPKDNYTVEGNVLSRLTKGTINAYLSKDRTFDDIVPPSPYLLDNLINVELVSALSFRRLSSSYNSTVLTIRRSSDNATLDIGFSGMYLDKTAALAFVGSGDGFIVKIFDQSGKGNHFEELNSIRQYRVIQAGTWLINSGGFVRLGRNSALNSTMKCIPSPALDINTGFTANFVNTNIDLGYLAFVGTSESAKNFVAFASSNTTEKSVNFIFTEKSGTTTTLQTSGLGTNSSICKVIPNSKITVSKNSNELFESAISSSGTPYVISNQITLSWDITQASGGLMEVLFINGLTTEQDDQIIHNSQIDYYGITI